MLNDDALKAAAEALSEYYEGDGWGYFGGAAEAAVAAAAPILLAEAQREVERLREVVSLALGVIDLDMKLHAPSASTAGCGGGIGGQMITPHCPDYCDHPKHDADKARREDLLNSLYRARIAETAPEEES